MRRSVPLVDNNIDCGGKEELNQWRKFILANNFYQSLQTEICHCFVKVWLIYFRQDVLRFQKLYKSCFTCKLLVVLLRLVYPSVRGYKLIKVLEIPIFNPLNCSISTNSTFLFPPKKFHLTHFSQCTLSLPPENMLRGQRKGIGNKWTNGVVMILQYLF